MLNSIKNLLFQPFDTPRNTAVRIHI